MNHATPSTRFAKFLEVLTRFAAIALPIIAAGIWLFWDDLAPLAGSGLEVTSLSASGRLAGFGLSLGAALLQAYGLLGLSRTFAEGAAGRALSAASVSGFRRFAWVTLWMVPARVVLTTAITTLVSMNDSVPGGSVALYFGSSEVSAVFIGLLLVFTAQVFAQGQAAQAENEAFL